MSLSVLDADGVKKSVNTLPALGQAAKAAALPVTLASDQEAVPIKLPNAGSATIVTCQTAAAGNNWTSFGAQACTQLSVVNNSGVDLEFRRGGGGAALPILNRMAYLIIGITNANQISIRRIDQDNSQVVLAAEALG